VYRGAEAPASTDHMLLLAHVKLQMPFQPRRPSAQKCFNVKSLCQDSGISMRYSVEIANRFQPISTLEDMDVEHTWHFLHDFIRKDAAYFQQ